MSPFKRDPLGVYHDKTLTKIRGNVTRLCTTLKAPSVAWRYPVRISNETGPSWQNYRDSSQPHQI